MAQVSYGTITITDTTDLTTYIRYATKAPLTAASQFQETPTTNTRYIAVLSIPASDPIPAWNSSSWKWLEFIGTDGVSVLGTREIYYLKTNSTTVAAPANGSDISQASANVENQWTKSVPTYVTNGEYWTCIQTHLDGSPTWVYGSPVLNQSLTDMNHDIDVMKSVTQQSMEDSQGAMSQAASAVKEVKRIWFAKATNDPPEDPPETGVTTGSASTHNSWSIVKPAENPSYPYYFYCDQTCTNGGVYSHSEILLEADPYTVNALNVRTKNFFHGKDSTYDGWFASGRSTSEGLNESDATTYHYNARVGAANITLGYNKTPVIDLDGGSGAINIYRLPTINSSTGLVTAAGKIGAKLNASVLTFYNTSGTATSTFGDSIALASNGAAITVGSTGTGKYNTYIDAQGLYLRTGTTPYATLKANGLVLSRGGVEAGTKNTNDYIYVYSHDDATNHTLAINNSGNKYDWRIIAGKNFGVDKAGNLYANEAHISGEITASKLTISSNATISDTSGLIRNDAVEVGGRNLLYNSGTMPAVSSGNKGWRASGGTVSHIDISTPPIAGVSGGIRCTNTGSSTARIGIAQDSLANRFIAGKKYSMGCWIRASAEFSSVVSIQPIWISSSQTTNSKPISMTLNTNWQYISAEGLALAGDQASSYSAGYVYASNVPAGGYIEVCGIMLEEGTKCTSWTPAPEDVASDIEDASKVADNFLKFESGENGGLMVADLNGASNTTIHGIDTKNVLIDSDSVDIREGQDILASFGAITTIGDPNAQHIEMSSNGYSLISNEQNTIFSVRPSGIRTTVFVQGTMAISSDKRTMTFPHTPTPNTKIYTNYSYKYTTSSGGPYSASIAISFTEGRSETKSSSTSSGTAAANYSISYNATTQKVTGSITPKSGTTIISQGFSIGRYTYESEGADNGVLEVSGGFIAYDMVGTIKMFAGPISQSVDADGIVTATGAPIGWLLCDGSAISWDKYQRLFKVIGYSYGSEGSGNFFRLPDLRGRFPLGVSTSHPLNGTGSTGGAETVTLSAANMPYHRHSIPELSMSTYGGFKPSLITAAVSTGSHSTSDNPILYANTSRTTSNRNTAYTGASNTGGSHSHTTNPNNTGYAGGSSGAATAHNNMPPYQTVNFIIATGETI